MMKKRLSLIISLVAAIVLLSAASALFLMDREQPAAHKVIESERPRVASPVTSDSEINALVDSNSAFAFDLYQALRETGGNLFYSPYSISLALAMAYAGARGETAAEMARTLQFLLPQNSLHPAFNSLAIELAGLGKGTRIRDGESFRLNIANAIWGQKDFRFQSGFLGVLAANYGAGLRLLDFAKVPEESRLTINDWISEQTENRIKDLIPQGVISRLTRLVLTNAIYFNAAWQIPFAEHATRDGIFHLLDGNEVTVPMMRQAKHLQF
ncbi:MAG: serpin family protein, partial [Dethiobacter sp.]|nr:serpin family protein [Dethiobacter sp.]